MFDDVSTYQICSLVTAWEVPCNDEAKGFLKRINNQLLEASFRSKNPADFYSVLWFKAKYDHHEDLLKFIDKYQNLWRSDTFLRRQVTAVMGRLLITNSKDIEKLLYTQVSSGITNTVSLANQIQIFSQKKKLDGKLRFYLFPTKVQRPYPLQKFLVLCSVLNSELIRIDAGVQAKVLEHIKDPYFLKWLDSQYNIQ